MKIVCDSCSTKYSIADEKVRGKVFKIKCKKCEYVILVRGTDGAESDGEPARDAGAAAGAAVGADAFWYVVVGREQVGPLSASDLEARWQRGEVDADTYAWREGYGDWQRLGEIDELPFRSDAPAPRATPSSDGADLFASAGQNSGGDEAAGDDQAAGGGVFASTSVTPIPRRPSGDDDLVASSMAAPGDSPRIDARGMTGERHENSVLFSLSNLAALANDGARQGAVAPGFSSGGGKDGSGLIDIRAMAAGTLAARKATAEAAAVDDLPVFSPSAFVAPSVGVLAPRASARQNRLLWGLVAGIGILALCAGALLVYTLKSSRRAEGGKERSAPAAAPSAKEPAGTGDNKPETPAPSAMAGHAGGSPSSAPDKGPAAPKAQDKKGGEAATVDKSAAKQTKAEEKAAPRAEKVAKAEKEVKEAHGPKGGVPAHEERPAKTQVEAPPPAKASTPSSKCDETLCLIDSSAPCCKKSAGASSGSDKGSSRGAAAASGGESKPGQGLGRSDIMDGMNGIKGRVTSCNDQYKVPGTIQVKIVVLPSGSVGSAEVVGKFAGTPTGSCVERAAKGAKFKKATAQSAFTYPFLLH